MKYLFFLLFPTLLSAQEITKDSSYTELVAGKYYAVRQVEYETGDQQTTKTLLGTSDQVYTDATNRFSNGAQSMATDAAFISNFAKRLTEIIRENTSLKTLIGKSPLDTLQAKNLPVFTAAGWTIKEPTGARDVVFSVNGAGQMKYKVGTDALKNCTLFGLWVVRLNNYPTTGTNTDLFRKQNGNYGDLLGNFVLKKPPSGTFILKKK